MEKKRGGKSGEVEKERGKGEKPGLAKKVEGEKTVTPEGLNKTRKTLLTIVEVINPLNSSYSSTPRENMSARASYRSPFKVSGLI